MNFFADKSGTKTFSRVLANKNFSQIGSVIFSVSAVEEKPLQFYI
jgi:hypothetical protein